jgi:hypothetical protein
MPRITKNNPVTFEELRKSLNTLNDMLERFENGEYLEHKVAKKMLVAYRKELTKVQLNVAGAREYSFRLQRQMMPKSELERVNSEPTDIGLENKVEVPD